MSNGSRAPHDDVIRYYEAKLRRHGPTPAGVDWNSESSQRRRFDELTGLIEPGHTVLDVGCGYGALLDHLTERGWNGEYLGFDLSDAMVSAATELHPERGVFSTEPPGAACADVVVASGLFNVRLDFDDETWTRYVDRTVTSMFEWCRVGLAFNLLTSYSDADRMVDRLHYESPSRMFDLVATACSRHVAILHDYGLYEFTVQVRRQPS